MIVLGLKMPFKTKKKKIAASTRKYSLAESYIDKPALKYSATEVSVKKTQSSATSTIEKNYDYVRHDLKSIFLLTLVIILFQLALIFIL